MPSTAPSSKRSSTPSVPISALACFSSEWSGSVRMRRKSSRVSAFSSTRIGRRPCNSGSRSEGLLRWKAPEAMNRIWSVRTGPWRVLTVVPSIKGSRSRCTPSRLTSPPRTPDSLLRAILSTSSRKTMPLFSAFSTAARVSASLSSSLSASSRASASRAAATVILRAFWRPPNILPNISCMFCIWPGGMPGMSIMPIGAPIGSLTCTSISRDSIWPSRSMRRNFSRVSPLAPSPTSAVTSRSSAASSALACTPLRAVSRAWTIAASTRSRTMDSTSRPT